RAFTPLGLDRRGVFAADVRNGPHRVSLDSSFGSPAPAPRLALRVLVVVLWRHRTQRLIDVALVVAVTPSDPATALLQLPEADEQAALYGGTPVGFPSCSKPVPYARLVDVMPCHAALPVSVRTDMVRIYEGAHQWTFSA